MILITSLLLKKKKKKFIFHKQHRYNDKVASLFEEGCQYGQKAINADHLYICFLIVNWINPDRQRQTNR